jgi:IS30 family transposase
MSSRYVRGPQKWKIALSRGIGRATWWEGSRETYIATLVERRSRFVILVKISEKRTDAVVDALAKAVRKLPAALRKLLAWDRGSELSDHAKFTAATDVKVYFCDPRSPWQRPRCRRSYRLHSIRRRDISAGLARASRARGLAVVS